MDAVRLNADKVDGDADGELLPRRLQVTADHGAVQPPRRVHQSSTPPRGVTLRRTSTTRYDTIPVADLGGGAAAPPLASFRKIHGLPISKTVRTADSTIIIITNFYLAARSHEIFLTVGGREGMHEGAWGTPKAPAAAPPLQKSWIRHCTIRYEMLV